MMGALPQLFPSPLRREGRVRGGCLRQGSLRERRSGSVRLPATGFTLRRRREAPFKGAAILAAFERKAPHPNLPLQAGEGVRRPLGRRFA